MSSRARVLTALAAAVSVVLVAAACAPTDTEPASDGTHETWIGEYGLDGLDAREVIEYLDAMPVDERPVDLMASVRPDVLLLSDVDGNETSLDLSEEEFYVSLAPYVDHTHDCYFHSLTTCLGELGNEDIDITVIATDDGAVLVDETIRTYDNGFAGIWLPRDIDATLTVGYAGMTASMPISTTGEDPTCISTLALT